MSKRLVLVLFSLVVAVLVLGGWALGQPQQEKRGAGDRFAVSGAGEGAVLLETATGKTWLLSRTGTTMVWRPITRFETQEQFSAWNAAERARLLKEMEEERARLRRAAEERIRP